MRMEKVQFHFFKGKEMWTQEIFTVEKMRVMFYLVGIFRASSPGDSISSDDERSCSEEARGGAGLCRSFATKGR